MNPNSYEIDLIGYLSLDLQFLGSKSEGTYPVLHGLDGNSYRLHVKGDSLFSESTLEVFAGNRVRVHGCVDDIRGHLRIVLDRNDPAMIELLPEESLENTDAKFEEGSTKNSDHSHEDNDKRLPSALTESVKKGNPDSDSCDKGLNGKSDGGRDVHE